MSNATCDINNLNCRKTRFLVLLISLLALMVLEPFIFDFIRIRMLIDIFFSIILFTSVYAVSEKRGTTLIAIFLALPKFGTTWFLGFSANPLIIFFDAIFGIIFIGYILILILKHIFKQENVSAETIYGAIVVYLLIGIMWVSLYYLTELFHPGSFSLAAGNTNESKRALYYFSFITLTTLGYGDISPLSAPARSLAMLEAIIGQMYLAVLIARLVGIHISQSLMKK